MAMECDQICSQLGSDESSQPHAAKGRRLPSLKPTQIGRELSGSDDSESGLHADNTPKHDEQPRKKDGEELFTRQRHSRAFAVITITLLVLNIVKLSFWSAAKELLWKNASVRPPPLLIVALAGWGWVVQVCRRTTMNLELVLGGPVQPPGATYHSALVLLAVLVVAHSVHIIGSDVYIKGLEWRPWLTMNLILHVTFVALGVLPRPVLQAESRHSLMRTLAESVMAPLAPVTFWHVIVADYLTSMARAFSDVQVTICIASHIFIERKADAIYVSSIELWRKYHNHCTDTYANAIVLALPFWWRLFQCLHVYKKTRERKNLWNALKYSTAFPLVYAGYMRNHAPSRYYHCFFVVAALVQSSYTFVWDVFMDWGLPQRVAARSRGAGACGLMLREPLIVSKRKAVYVALCVGNFLVRFAWTLSVFGGIANHGVGMLLFELIELLRRTVWAIFRIEWEVIVKTPDGKVEKREGAGRSPEELVPLSSAEAQGGGGGVQLVDISSGEELHALSAPRRHG